MIEIETYNSRKTHLTYSCVSWHLCVHSCPDPLSGIHTTPLFTLFALFHYSSIMDSQANCGVNDLGTGNVSCDEQPLIDRKQNVPTLSTVNTSKSSRSILTCLKPIMSLLLVGGYLAVLSLNGVFHSHRLLEHCDHPHPYANIPNFVIGHLQNSDSIALNFCNDLCLRRWSLCKTLPLELIVSWRPIKR